MAKYTIPDSEEYMECPYNKEHMVRVKRFQYHLMKCRKNYTGSAFVTCPFNAKHEMPKPELRYHMSSCPDKAAIELDLAHAAKREANADVDHGCTDLPAYKNVYIPQSECWDDELSSNPRIGVDPSHFTKFKFVNLVGAKWSSRQQEEQIAEEQIYSHRPASIPSNYSPTASKPTMPATVFNYSVGIGRGGGRQMNEPQRHMMKKLLLQHHLNLCPFTEIQELDLALAAENIDFGDTEHDCLAVIDYEDLKVQQTECWDDEAEGKPDGSINHGYTYLHMYEEFHLLQTECWNDEIVNQEPPLEVKHGNGQSFRRGLSILQARVFHQKPVNGVQEIAVRMPRW